MIKLENILTCANSVYQIGEQVNRIERKNSKAIKSMVTIHSLGKENISKRGNTLQYSL